MIKATSNSILSYLIKNGIIRNEIEIYQYGLELLVSSFLGVLIILSISFLTDHMIEGFIFLTCFIIIRKYTGGYHCKTYFTCKCAFVGIFVIFLIFSDFLRFDYILNFTFMLSFVTIWIFAPCDHENKKLNNNEKKHYKRISRGILSIYLFIIYILSYQYLNFAIDMEIILIIIAILLIMGKLERRRAYEKS